MISNRHFNKLLGSAEETVRINSIKFLYKMILKEKHSVLRFREIEENVYEVWFSSVDKKLYMKVPVVLKPSYKQ